MNSIKKNKSKNKFHHHQFIIYDDNNFVLLSIDNKQQTIT
jgi:hypothetical protein